MNPNDWSGGKKFAIISLILFVGVLVGLFLNSSIFKPAVITVTGLGEENVVPTEVNLIATRLDAGTDPVAAIAQNETAVDKLISIAKNYKGDNGQITKSFYQVTPQNGQYVVVNGINIKSTNVKSVNDLIKDLYKNGAATISNVSFSPGDKGTAEQQARKTAIVNARQNALKMASAAGKRLGKLLSVIDDTSNSSTGTVSEISSTATTAQGISSIKVSKQVQMVYEIW